MNPLLADTWLVGIVEIPFVTQVCHLFCLFLVIRYIKVWPILENKIMASNSKASNIFLSQCFCHWPVLLWITSSILPIFSDELFLRILICPIWYIFTVYQPPWKNGLLITFFFFFFYCIVKTKCFKVVHTLVWKVKTSVRYHGSPN